ncbi:MAG TPA: FtsW/RodA/SpoVE family cell cycle protein [Candidatus Paceibacterota bacterium]
MRHSVDTPFLLISGILTLFGLLIFTSAAMGLLARGGASFSSVAISQVLLGLVGGGIALFIIANMDYRKWRAWTPHFFVFSLFLTALTLTHFGLSLKGASRWLVIGPISFQPVEILKLASVALLAALFSARIKDIRSVRASFVPFLTVVGIASAVLLLQPDTHGVVMIAVAGAAMLFAAGGRVSYLASLALLGIVVIGMLAWYRPYLRARFETFLNPGADALGAGYQVQQSLIAVGSGGMWGRGFGQSMEKFSYLPEPIGDSIFAVAAEEFGFIGSTLLVLLFAAFALLGLRVAARSPDAFGSLMVVGLVVLIAGQSFVNIGTAIGIVPLSGLPLIFVSHGGTALAISLAEVGVILSVSRRMKSAD